MPHTLQPTIGVDRIFGGLIGMRVVLGGDRVAAAAGYRLVVGEEGALTASTAESSVGL